MNDDDTDRMTDEDLRRLQALRQADALIPADVVGFGRTDEQRKMANWILDDPGPS